jgi:hypothetical protein
MERVGFQAMQTINLSRRKLKETEENSGTNAVAHKEAGDNDVVD